MSYATGIGSLQQAINSISSSETKPGAPANNTDSDVASPATPSPDRANLSSTGEIVSHALEGSDTRSTKVAALQQAIAAGSYSVSSSDVADKIIQSLLD